VAQGAPFRFVRNAAVASNQGTPFRFLRDAAAGPKQGAPFRFVRGAVASNQGTPFRFVRGTPIVVSGSSTFHIVRGEEAPVPNQGSSTFHIIRGEEFPVPNQGSSTFQSERGTIDPTNGLIRGPQFRGNTIGGDRFNNRLTTVLSSIAIDLSVTGQTTIYTVPAGKIALIQGVIFLARGTAASDPTVSVGINPSTDDIFASQQLVNFQTSNDVFSLWSDKSTTLVANASDQIDLDVTVSSSLAAAVYVIGILL
jgi:hypothetical protein